MWVLLGDVFVCGSCWGICQCVGLVGGYVSVVGLAVVWGRGLGIWGMSVCGSCWGMCQCVGLVGGYVSVGLVGGCQCVGLVGGCQCVGCAYDMCLPMPSMVSRCL